MSELPVPTTSNTFERIKRVTAEGQESWSARDLARVLEYLNFRNFQPVIEKAKEACIKSGHAVADHFAEIRNMVDIGSGAQREVEDWTLSRYACYLVIQNADFFCLLFPHPMPPPRAGISRFSLADSKLLPNRFALASKKWKKLEFFVHL